MRSEKIVEALRNQGLTVCFAESCTGGRLSADLTTVPGSSEVVLGSAVCYALKAKHRVLGLQSVTEQNVVSSETAEAMATAAKELFDADIGVATTGYLDGDHPQAFWAIVGKAKDQETPFSIVGLGIEFPTHQTREQNRQKVVDSVMVLLARILGIKEVPAA